LSCLAAQPTTEPAKGAALDIPLMREADDGSARGWLPMFPGALRAPGLPLVEVFMAISFGVLNLEDDHEHLLRASRE